MPSAPSSSTPTTGCDPDTHNLTITMKCGKCGKERQILYIGVNITTGKSRPVCVDCEVARLPEALTLDEVDSTIEELLKQKRSMERLIEKIPDVQPVSAILGVPNIGFGPLETLASINAMLKNAQQDRANILAATTDPIIPQEPPASEDNQSDGTVPDADDR